MSEYSVALIEAVERGAPAWIRGAVETRLATAQASPPSAEWLADIERATTEWIVAALREALAPDVAAQRQNPLAVIRSGVRFATTALQSLGVPPALRDPFDQRVMPDDVYALAPAAFSDLGPDVHEAGIVWGAWKAHTIMRRRTQSPPND